MLAEIKLRGFFGNYYRNRFESLFVSRTSRCLSVSLDVLSGGAWQGCGIEMKIQNKG